MLHEVINEFQSDDFHPQLKGVVYFIVSTGAV